LEAKMGLEVATLATVLSGVGAAASGIKALTTKAPKASAAPAASVQADKDAMPKATRAQLYATQGGATGQELQTGQVKSRGTLFGN
jgi:hypothetical protein